MISKRWLVWGMGVLLALMSFAQAPPGMVAGQDGLDQTYTWAAKSLSIDYPAGWAAEVVLALNGDMLVLAEDAADIASLTSGDDAPQSPLLLVVATADPEQFWPDIIAATLAETASNWTASALGAPVPVTPTTLLGEPAYRATGPMMNDGLSADAVITLLPGGLLSRGLYLIVVAAMPDARVADFTPTFDAMLASITRTAAPEPSADAVPVTPGVVAPPIDFDTVAVIGARAHDLQTSPGRILYSPDGRYILYEDRADGDEVICRWDGLLDQTECLPIEEPRAFPRGIVENSSPFRPSVVSLDGSRLAVVGQSLIFFQDADLWVVDFDDESFTHWVDDGVPENEQMGFGDDRNPNMTLPVQPAWSPDGMQIAFEHTTLLPDSDFAPSTISVLDLATGNVRDLTTLPGTLPGEIDLGSTLALAWSPDGTTLAASFRHNDLNETADGVYLIDVATGELTQLYSHATLQTALQAVLPELPLRAAYPLRWSPDSARLLLWVGDSGAINGGMWPFVADVGTGELTPVPLPRHPDAPEAFRFIQPVQAAWSPDGRALLVATRELEPLPDEPVNMLAGEAAQDRLIGVRLIELATGEMTLLGHLPNTIPPWFEAAWGVEAGGGGHVLVNNHYLALAYESAAGADADAPGTAVEAVASTPEK